MSPRSPQKNASQPDADLCRQHNSATVPSTESRPGKVGDPCSLWHPLVSLRSPPFNHKPTNYRSIDNPPGCLRRAPRPQRFSAVPCFPGPRPAQPGLFNYQDGGFSLKAGCCTTYVEMPPFRRSARGGREGRIGQAVSWRRLPSYKEKKPC